MNDIPEGEELLKAFPEWGEEEEALWLELFQEFCLALIGARLDPEAMGEGIARLSYSDRFSACRGEILMAAELADAAVEEAQDRIQVQTQHKESERRKRLSETARRRRARRESLRKK